MTALPFDEELVPYRECNRCGKVMPLSEFYRQGKHNLPVRRCKKCHGKATVESRLRRLGRDAMAQKQREYNARRDPRTRVSNHFRSRYGLTIDEWEALAASQDNACAICQMQIEEIQPHPSGNRTLHVDHCHDTNRVRGLLCSNCNRAIGAFRDDPEIMRRAIAYIEERGVPMARANEHWVAKPYTNKPRKRRRMEEKRREPATA